MGRKMAEKAGFEFAVYHRILLFYIDVKLSSRPYVDHSNVNFLYTFNRTFIAEQFLAKLIIIPNENLVHKI